VGRRLAGERAARVVVVGGPGEESLCEQVASGIEGARPLAGPLPLDRLAGLLARCTSTLCNDSGLMHLSEAVNTPVVAVFGPTSRELGFYPTHPDSVVIEQDVPCRPCSRTGARPCHQPQNWCMTWSTADLVRSRLEAQWERILQAGRATSI
jgi:heptosyltransferase-2